MDSKNAGRYADDVIVRSGELVSGREWKISEIHRSAVPDGAGKHYVLTAGYEPEDQLPQCEKVELLGLALRIGEQLSTELSGDTKRFRVAVNGPALQTRTHFHVHIICVQAGVNVMRLTDSIVVLQP